MPEEHEVENPAFIRQRRNLILGALIILLLETTVSLPEELQITGVTLRITHADYVIYWVWMFSVYWLIRFFQYLPPIEDIFDVAKVEHSKSLKRLLRRVVNKHRIEKGEKLDNDDYMFYVSEKDIFLPRQTGIGRLVVVYRSISWKKRSDGTTGSGDLQGGYPSVSLRPAAAIYFKLVAAIDLVIRTPLFTEYLLPILLLFGAAFSSAHRLL